MEFMAEFTEGMSRDRARQIIKRKRTKRQRPCSPSVSENISISSQEDEDMANCLIMLAQSVDSKSMSKEVEYYADEKLVKDLVKSDLSNLYVYECKTCNRTFNSFQALGGHRASHKKLKMVSVNVEDKKLSSLVNNNIIIQPPFKQEVDQVDDEEENKESIIVTNNVFVNIINNNSNNTKAKVHECSICGSEFLSGQALGGHMRKHRPIPVSSHRDQMVEKSPVGSDGVLLLDLNFPPPEFQFSANNSSSSSSQQQHNNMVFSAPAFVHCHY